MYSRGKSIRIHVVPHWRSKSIRTTNILSSHSGQAWFFASEIEFVSFAFDRISDIWLSRNVPSRKWAPWGVDFHKSPQLEWKRWESISRSLLHSLFCLVHRGVERSNSPSEERTPVSLSGSLHRYRPKCVTQGSSRRFIISGRQWPIGGRWYWRSVSVASLSGIWFGLDFCLSSDDRIRSYLTSADWKAELAEASEVEWIVDRDKFSRNDTVRR